MIDALIAERLRAASADLRKLIANAQELLAFIDHQLTAGQQEKPEVNAQ